MNGGVVCRHLSLEPTEEGKKLELTGEMEQNCKVIYKKDEEGTGYAFYDFWDQENILSESGEYIVLPLRSIYKGTFSYKTTDTFANVIGSTGDPIPSPAGAGYRSWLDLFADMIGIERKALHCVMQNRIYNSMTGGIVCDGQVCDDNPDKSSYNTVTPTKMR